jgi:hypothetical protein
MSYLSFADSVGKSKQTLAHVLRQLARDICTVFFIFPDTLYVGNCLLRRWNMGRYYCIGNRYCHLATSRYTYVWY